MTSFEPVRVHNCNNCGFSMRQFNPNSMMMVCESCGTRVGESIPPKYTPEVPLNPLFKLHEQFEKNGATWQVIGCQSYAGSVEEWDSEDKKWERTPWSYHVWWVLNEAREIAWISQDKTGYSWSHKKTVSAGIPEGDRSYEIGSYTLISAVGEFSYVPREAEQIRIYEKDGRSLEILLDENGENQEIEAFQDVKIDLLDLLSSFGKQSVVDAMKRSKSAMTAAFSTVACLVLGYMIMQGFEKTLITIPTVSIDSKTLKQVIPLGQFEMEKPGLIELDFLANSGSRDGSFDADIVISDSDKTSVAELPVSFWRESGRDSDGPWTESQYRNAPRISLPAGSDYTLSLVPDTLKQWQSINLRGKVTRNVVSLFPIIAGGMAAALLAIIIGVMRRKRMRRETGVGL